MTVQKMSREIKAYRAKHGYTQKDVAEKLGISEIAYNRRENGQLDFYVSELRKLIEVLQIPEEDVIRIFFNHNVA